MTCACTLWSLLQSISNANKQQLRFQGTGLCQRPQLTLWICPCSCYMQSSSCIVSAALTCKNKLVALRVTHLFVYLLSHGGAVSSWPLVSGEANMLGLGWVRNPTGSDYWGKAGDKEKHRRWEMGGWWWGRRRQLPAFSDLLVWSFFLSLLPSVPSPSFCLSAQNTEG